MQGKILIDFMIFFVFISNIFIQLQYISKCEVFFKMAFVCCDESCKISFSTRINGKKHEKLKGHAPETSNREIPRDEKSGLFKCLTTDCATTSKYKYNIIKHLKSSRKVNKNKKGANKNKICTFYSKVFTKKLIKISM